MLTFKRSDQTVTAEKYTGRNGPRIIQWAAGAIREVPKVGKEQIHLVVETPSGPVKATIGDWIIKGVAGDFSTCNPDDFGQLYEEELPF